MQRGASKASIEMLQGHTHKKFKGKERILPHGVVVQENPENLNIFCGAL